jgi:hypothetical protein
MRTAVTAVPDLEGDEGLFVPSYPIAATLSTTAVAARCAHAVERSSGR